MIDTFRDLFTQLQDWNAEGNAAPLWIVGLVAFLGAAVSLSRLWPNVRIGATLFHELGHALAGLSIGGRVSKIRLETNTSGVTHWEFSGRKGPGRLRTAWVAAGGYLTPGLFGGLALFSYLTGWSRVFGTALVALIVIALLLWVRNLWGFLITSIIVVIGGGLLFSGIAGAEVLSILVASFLVTAGIRASFEHMSEPRSQSSDSEVVAHNILIPRKVIQFYFLLMSILIPASLFLLYYFKGDFFSA